jgi:hypothetical protein
LQDLCGSLPLIHTALLQEVSDSAATCLAALLLLLLLLLLG